MSQNRAAGGRHVAVFRERVAAQQAVDHRLGGLEAAAIDRPHVGEGVEDVHPPLAIDLLVGELVGEVLEERFQLGLLPGRGGSLAFGMETAGQHPQPLGAGQGPDHHGILRRDAGPDAVLGGEAGHQGRGFLRAALRVQVVVEGEVLVVGRFAQRFVAADGAVVLALRAEDLAHEKALAHLRSPVGRGGHRHLRRGVEAAGQAAKLQDFELVALVDRQQLRPPSCRVVLRKPIAQIGCQVLDLFRTPNDVAVAFIWKWHISYFGVFPGVGILG